MLALCLCSASLFRIGRAFWLMYTERSVWLGYVGTESPVSFRVTFFLPLTIVVVFRTTIVTWRLPQRSTDATEPANFLVTTIFFFAAFVAALASTIGSASVATVRTVVMILRIGPFALESELLDVDKIGRNVGAANVLLQELGERRRTADVHLAFGDVRDEVLQVVRGQQQRALFGGVIAHDEEQCDPALPRKRLQLLPEDHVLLPHDAIDDDHVAGHVLHQRTDGRDPDSARDQNDLLATAGCFGEDTERPFGDNACSGRNVG